MSVELAIQTVSGLSIILLIGIILTSISTKIKISNIFLLIMSGIGLSYLNIIGVLSMNFSDVLLISLAMITLVLVVLEGSSRFTIKRIEQYSIPALKIMSVFILLSLIGVTLAAAMLFFGSIHLESVIFSMIIAVTLAGTDPTSVFKILKNSANKAVQILELESIFNTPLTVIFPFILIEVLNSSYVDSISQIVVGQITPLVLQITEGIGMGVLFGFFIAKLVKRFYSKDLSPIMLLTAALLAYVSSEAIGGSGILTVATMGIFVGNMIAESKEREMEHFSSLLGNIFVMIVFILVGFLVDFNISLDFLSKIGILYFAMLIVRFISISLTVPKQKFNLKEKLFMTLMIPKGIAVAVVVLSLAVLNLGAEYISYTNITIQVIVFSMLISLLIATIVGHFEHKFLAPVETVEVKKITKKKK